MQFLKGKNISVREKKKKGDLYQIDTSSREYERSWVILLLLPSLVCACNTTTPRVPSFIDKANYVKIP